MQVLASPVIVSYEDVKNPNKDLSKEIEEAFGFSGIGLIVVKGIPTYPELRARLLPMGTKFAKLPDSIKEKYVHEKSHYSFGWSHGKEMLKKGQPDFYKGSFYNNPQYDVPTTDPSMIASAPEVCLPNIWPTEDLPELESAFKELGQLIVDVGIQLAYHCDKHVINHLGDNFQSQNHLQNVIRSSRSTKARLLHYFEIPDGDSFQMDSTDIDSWCGWHNDHGSLTGLCSANYQDINTGKIISCPDPEAGLYVRTRGGGVQQVKIPSDCLAFQIGESAQIMSSGILRATPHCVKVVRPSYGVNVARDTFAVFMQPNFYQKLEIPKGFVGDLGVRQFKEGMDFGAFGKATIELYYEM